MTEENWIGRASRHETNVEAFIYRLDGTRIRAMLTEMSEGGCRIETSVTLPIGQSIQIAIPRMGQIRAHIRWSLGNAAGARFDVKNYA